MILQQYKSFPQTITTNHYDSFSKSLIEMLVLTRIRPFPRLRFEFIAEFALNMNVLMTAPFVKLETW